MGWEFWLNKDKSNWIQWEREEGKERWNKKLNLKEKNWVQGNVLGFPLTPHC